MCGLARADSVQSGGGSEARPRRGKGPPGTVPAPAEASGTAIDLDPAINPQDYGVGEIFERVIQELIAKMREVDMVSKKNVIMPLIH